MKIGATDIYERYIPNQFNVLDKISLHSKKNDALLSQLKEMALEFKDNRDVLSEGES